MKHRIGSKISKVKAHLVEQHLPLTPLQALGLYGVFRLASDIEKLRLNGNIIITTIKRAPTGSTYAEYRLAAMGMKVLHTDAEKMAERGIGEVIGIRNQFNHTAHVVVKWANGSVSSYTPNTQNRIVGVE